MSRAAFEARFPDEASCARHLAARRWPDGFVCPACGHDRGWELKRRRASWECAACGKETSVTAGTIMHRRHLPLKTWFMAVHIVTSHSNGISALQLQAQLGLGSYKSAWLLLHKLRRAMVDPDRSLLEDLIEIDEATLPFRTAKDPATGGQGRSPQGKMRIAGAVELSPEGEPRRIRLAPIGDFSARSLRAFVAGTSAPGARVISDGWSGYCGLPDHDHQPKVVGATPAHLVLTWIHRVFSNLKRWALGTFHGLRRAHLRRYLDEFVLPLEPPPPQRNGRIRLAPIGDFSARSLRAFVAGTSAPGARVITAMAGAVIAACPTTTTSPRSSVQRPPISC